MKQFALSKSRKTGILGTVFGGLLIGLPTIPVAASAAPSQVLNPCPRIYYEEPFSSTRPAPEGCPPNTATQLLSGQGQTAQQPTASSTTVAQPPLPEARANAIASVMPMDGNVNVRLKNNTNALITYEAVGYTGRRSLPGGEEIVLRNLPVPVTITTVRQDEGLVDVTPVSSEQGVLEVSLNESKNLDDNAGALRIQKDGQVFLN